MGAQPYSVIFVRGGVMRLRYLGKHSLGTVRVLLFFDEAAWALCSVVSHEQSSLVQAYKKLVLAPSKVLDLSKLHDLCASHSTSLELFTTDATRELAEREEAPSLDKSRWLESALKKVDQELAREKAQYGTFRGVRDLDVATDHLRNRREEIFELEKKILRRADEPSLVHVEGSWVRVVPHNLDVAKLKELRYQAQARSSALKQRIDFTRRARIRALEDKRRALWAEIETERRHEKARIERVAERTQDGVGLLSFLTVRSRPILVQGRRNAAVRAALAEVDKTAKVLTSTLRERLGLEFKEPDELFLLSNALVTSLHSLRESNLPIARLILEATQKTLTLTPRDALDRNVARAVENVLARIPHTAKLPDLSRFPQPEDALKRRYAYLGLALRHDLKPTHHPVFFDLDEQGPRHVAVAGGSGSGKSVAASLIVEGAALHGVPVLVFDPTRSWTGFAMPCSGALLDRYEDFQMRREWARAFDLEVVELDSGTSLTRFLDRKGITVLMSSHLTQEEEAGVAARLLAELLEELKARPESSRLKLLVVLEEAHRYLADKKLEPLVELLARTARVKGVGLVFVSQNATDLPPEVRNNCATKIQLHTNYSEDLKRSAQTFGSDYRTLIPKFERATGAFQFPEYGTALVAFRPPLHQPSAITGEVARFCTRSKEMGRIVATLLGQEATPLAGSEAEEGKPDIAGTTNPAPTMTMIMRRTAPRTALACGQCGHGWTPRKDADEVKECPSCKSRLWRTEAPRVDEALP